MLMSNEKFVFHFLHAFICCCCCFAFNFLNWDFSRFFNIFSLVRWFSHKFISTDSIISVVLSWSCHKFTAGTNQMYFYGFSSFHVVRAIYFLAFYDFISSNLWKLSLYGSFWLIFEIFFKLRSLNLKNNKNSK